MAADAHSLESLSLTDRSSFIDVAGDGGVLKNVIKAGDGPTPQEGDQCAVEYVGVCNGTEFDRNVGGYPFEFTLGDGKVVKGWEVAFASMKLGDKVQLVLTGEYGYGEDGSGTDIPPGAELTFDITFVNLKSVGGKSVEVVNEEKTRLAELKLAREAEAAKKLAEKEERERKSAEMKAKMAEKLAAKQGGKKGGKGKKGK